MAKGCTGADLSNCCWRCGDPGHKAVTCKKSPGLANESPAIVESGVPATVSMPCDAQDSSN